VAIIAYITVLCNLLKTGALFTTVFKAISECKLVKSEVATVEDFKVPHHVCKMSIPDSQS